MSNMPYNLVDIWLLNMKPLYGLETFGNEHPVVERSISHDRPPELHRFESLEISRCMSVTKNIIGNNAARF
jgi:hypothetical protein